MKYHNAPPPLGARPLRSAFRLIATGRKHSVQQHVEQSLEIKLETFAVTSILCVYNDTCCKSFIPVISIKKSLSLGAPDA